MNIFMERGADDGSTMQQTISQAIVEWFIGSYEQDIHIC